jgi:hypothetical protein
MKKNVNFFVSYAHANQALAHNFIKKFKEYAEPSKNYKYMLWDDTGILVGENWDEEIKLALKKCNLGLLLISASFLGSKYITTVELKKLRTRPVIPVLLWQVDFQRYDLKGLQHKQIFKLNRPRFQEPKAYGDCNTRQRNQFILDLFGKVELRLDKLRF